jgi:two-component system response regulator (stage 0 sporulation protein F)
MKTSRTVMIVENEASSGKLLSKLIKNEGHSTVIARTGSEALILLETLSFDLITLNPGLPDKPGSDFLEELNRRNVETPVIVVSSDPARLVATELVTAVVTKPFVHTEFVQVVRQQLGQWIFRHKFN